jgi:hypothetical protein
MSSWERFSFAGPNVRLRSSTVEGLSNTASFCIETRCDDNSTATEGDGKRQHNNHAPGQPLSLLGW